MSPLKKILALAESAEEDEVMRRLDERIARGDRL
jgi:hypothetical protein